MSGIVPSRRSVVAGVAGMTLAATIPAGRASAGSVEPLAEGYVIPGERAFPTGMAYDRRTGHFYVGSAEDGALYRGHLTRPEADVWSPKEQDSRRVTSGMTLDRDGRLYVGGADTHTLRVYDTRTRRLLATMNGAVSGFLNEITVADDGLAYATDSYVPVIYRVAREGGHWRIEHWLDVAASPIDWVDGAVNLNGILAAGRHLLTVNSNTGQLWRVDRHTRQAVQVDLGGHPLRNGDGLALRGDLLYVVQGSYYEGARPQVTVLTMANDLSRGRYSARYDPPGGFLHPSAIALTARHALVVNSQYNRWREGLPPVTPFRISTVPLAGAQPPS
ncbi:hypothetical protein ABZ912_55025 [Nonomuraea angiospora]|uniref:SMP-30/gluconolactonase/LRE family protein n=1 Tax=Nonomuraea angiospora TaxID=46172 RepID=UPI0033D0A96F